MNTYKIFYFLKGGNNKNELSCAHTIYEFKSSLEEKLEEMNVPVDLDQIASAEKNTETNQPTEENKS